MPASFWILSTEILANLPGIRSPAINPIGEMPEIHTLVLYCNSMLKTAPRFPVSWFETLRFNTLSRGAKCSFIGSTVDPAPRIGTDGSCPNPSNGSQSSPSKSENRPTLRFITLTPFQPSSFSRLEGLSSNGSICSNVQP